ncbi:RNA-directed DNA polymerase, eukaryota, reverse transcriptase zinc-binding domain protein [Tanacetum coccineum]
MPSRPQKHRKKPLFSSTNSNHQDKWGKEASHQCKSLKKGPPQITIFSIDPRKPLSRNKAASSMCTDPPRKANEKINRNMNEKENKSGFVEVEYKIKDNIQTSSEEDERNSNVIKQQGGKQYEKIKENESYTNSQKKNKQNKSREKNDCLSKKAWSMKDDILQAMRRSANKFSVLEVVFKDAWNIRELNQRDRQIKVIKLRKEEKLDVCVVLESYLKGKKLHKTCIKVFGYWKWASNNDHSRSGCRIIIGWNGVENRGMDRRELWNDLRMHKQIINGSSWVVIRDTNVTLKTSKHTMGGSSMTTNMEEFEKCVNDIEVTDLCSSGMFFTWSKNPKSVVPE